LLETKATIKTEGQSGRKDEIALQGGVRKASVTELSHNLTSKGVVKGQSAGGSRHAI